MYFYQQDLTPSDINEYHDYLKQRVEYNYNPDFDPRSIVGDDYSDKTERIYGNNDGEREGLVDAFESLDGVMGLLGDRYGMVAGWTHFLAFDLFVGAWVVRDAGSRGVPHLLCVVPLLLTFLAGPLGLLLYLLVRQIRARSVIPQPSEVTR